MKEQNELHHVFKYDVVLQQILDRAGWHPGRKCQKWAAKQKRHLEREGFTVYPATIRVLEEFGELKIGDLAAYGKSEQAAVHVEPETSQAAVDLFKEYEILTKIELCPLGTYGDEDFIGISPDGSVYYVGDWIWYLGDSFAHAIEGLILGKERAKD